MLYAVNDNIVYSDITLDFFETGKELIDLIRRNPTKEEQNNNEILKTIREQIGDLAEEQVIDMGKQHNLFLSLRRLTLIMTNACNFRCSYCYEDFYENGKLNNPKNQVIHIDSCIKYIEKISNIYDKIESICFFGGEPLLELESIKNICKRIKGKGYNTRFSVITNGSIYNNKVFSLLKEYQFGITVSLDGPEEYHNFTRISKNGLGTYKIVTDNVKNMIMDGLSVSIQGTLTVNHINKNFGVIEFLKFLKEEFNVCNAHIVPVQYNDNSEIQWIGDAVEKLIKSYLDYDMYNIKKIEEGRYEEILFSSAFFDVLVAIINKKRNYLICPSGTELAISTDGILYPCFMLVDKDCVKPLGDLRTPNKVLRNNIIEYIQKTLKDNNRFCSNCYAKNICHGCVGANVNENKSVIIPSNVLCTLTRERVKNLIVYINDLQRERKRWANFVTHFNLCFNSKRNNYEY
ncbi:MAG: radical SAM protein [Treponemataceae bacterium]|nr:radical SAM protein [Treponemataceae bacterium]